jgi:antitoxin ParD1/3/4
MLKGDAMPTRNVVLSEHQADLVERLVSTGRYQNASEVLRDGLRLVESREAEHEARLKALREAARVGIADVRAGRFTSFDSVDQLQKHLRAVSADSMARKDPTVVSK